MSARTTVSERVIPEGTVARLPVYLRALTTLGDQGFDSVGSDGGAGRGVRGGLRA